MVDDERFPAKPLAFVRTNASVLLDLIRGLAAVIVLMEHWRNIFFVSFYEIPSHRSLMIPFYLASSAGHQAVVIFFVLSGYLISGSVFRMLDRGTWNWKLYFTHRLLRLWIVLIPGLLLCAMWDGLGLHLDLAPKLYHGLSPDHTFGDASAGYTVRTFLGNAFFLQNLVVTEFGSDGALWSLANEFWYYVLFPLGLFAVLPKTSTPLRVACVACFGGVAWFTWPSILAGFPIWLLGTVLALVRPPKLGLTARAVATLLYLPLFFFANRLLHTRQIYLDYLLGVFTFFFLWIVLSATSASRPSPGERFSRGLSRFSFTLYVVHMPLCVFLAALILGDTRWQPTPLHLLEATGIMLLVFAYAYVLASLTEFRTDRVRRWIETRLFAWAA